MSSIGSLKKTARERMRSFYWAAFTVNNIANFYNVYNWIGSLSRLLTGSKEVRSPPWYLPSPISI